VNYPLDPRQYSQFVSLGDVFRLCLYVPFKGSAREISSCRRALSETAVLEERQRIARDLCTMGPSAGARTTERLGRWRVIYADRSRGGIRAEGCASVSGGLDFHSISPEISETALLGRKPRLRAATATVRRFREGMALSIVIHYTGQSATSWRDTTVPVSARSGRATASAFPL
jgi:hypothetical protein